jgi:SpoVK/Ycf46/Vps4 family AAA+-type ATPase
MQSKAFTPMPAGSRLSDSSLQPETQQQLSQLIAGHKWQPAVKDTTQPAKTQPGRVVVFCGSDAEAHAKGAAALGVETGRTVYRVHLSAVISKYIGETEKNLDRLFKKAVQANAVLFFDEADALFGKRTGIKDAHDKYANQEVNYLLAQAEAQGVVVIVGVTAKSNIDKAFLRRLRFIVQF